MHAAHNALESTPGVSGEDARAVKVLIFSVVDSYMDVFILRHGISVIILNLRELKTQQLGNMEGMGQHQ